MGVIGGHPPCIPFATAGSDVGVAPGGSTSFGSCLMGRGWNPGGGQIYNQNTMVKIVCMYIITQFQSKMQSTTKNVPTTKGGIWCWLLIQLRSSRLLAPPAQASRWCSSSYWALSSATFSLQACNTKIKYSSGCTMASVGARGTKGKLHLLLLAGACGPSPPLCHLAGLGPGWWCREARPVVSEVGAGLTASALWG